MLPPADSYEALRRDFRWAVLPRFNLATACFVTPAAVDGEATALLLHGADGAFTPVSRAALLALSSRIANALRALGVGRGDRVALLLPQMPETAAVHGAAWMLGAVSVPLSVLFGVDALRYRLEDSGARVLVALGDGADKAASFRDALPELRAVVSVDRRADGAHLLSDLLARSSDAATPEDTLADDPAVMVYTSGTTGAPKGALHAHRVLLGHLPGVQFSHEGLPRPGDRLWTPADWAWAGGLFNILLPGLLFGLPVVASRSRFEPETAWTIMRKGGVRNVFLPPTALKLMRGAPPPAARPALRTLASGGESLGRETYEWGQSAFGLRINEFYGQTEANYVLSSSACFGVSRAGAIGKPVPGHDVAVIDADGRRCGPDEEGEIAVASPDPVMFLGYWNRPDATAAKFVDGPDGTRWMRTGDRGATDADGYVSFVGRDDDVITSSGFRIGPAEIEDCLASHPAVRLAVAVGKPDPVRTEIVKAYVVLRDGVAPEPTLADAIRGYVRERLSAHEYPREVAFVDDIALTTTGKVIRRHFRDMARREAREGPA